MRKFAMMAILATSALASPAMAHIKAWTIGNESPVITREADSALVSRSFLYLHDAVDGIATADAVTVAAFRRGVMPAFGQEY